MKKILVKGLFVLTVSLITVSNSSIASATEVETSSSIIKNKDTSIVTDESQEPTTKKPEAQTNQNNENNQSEATDKSNDVKEEKMINGFNEDQYNAEKEKALQAGFTEEQFEGIMNIPKIESGPVIQTRAAMTSDQTKVVNMAKAQLGKPYAWGAQGPGSFDCGGLVRYVYKNSVGKDIPMGTENQRNYGKAVSMNSLLPGDLLFWLTKGTNVTEHVAIYIGNGQFIHAPQPGQVVTTVNMNYLNPNGWYPSFARRILPEAPVRQKIVQGSPNVSWGNILSYRGHVQSNDYWIGGTLGYVNNGQTCGTEGKYLRLEWIEVLHDGQSNRVEIDAHVQRKGWTGWKKGSNGSQGEGLRMEAVKMRLVADDNLKNNYNIVYRTHVQSKGWTPWVKNGAVSGTTGQGLRIEAIQIKTERK